MKKLKKGGQPSQGVVEIPPKEEAGQDDSKLEPSDDSIAKKPSTVPSRSTVLQACTVTSSLIGALGIFLRQVRISFSASHMISPFASQL